MDGAAFDRVVRRLELSARRRTLLAGLTGAGLAGGVTTSPDLAVAKKKKKKKVTICRKGQTLSVVKKKKQKYLKPGDTAGACSTTTRPPATTTLPPRCPAARPNYCARLESCQPSCAAGHAFDAESCACVCSPATTCCVCTRGAEILEFPNMASQSDCAEACANAGGTGPVFAGGDDGSAAVAHPTEAQCTVTCTPEPMTCPAGFNPDTCGSGLVCCAPEDDGGCCSVDSPTCCPTFCCGRQGVCCEAGGCCSEAFPLCCGSVCCRPDSSCCSGDGACDSGQVCAINDGDVTGCCVDAPERSRRSQGATMMRVMPATPRRQRGR